MKLKALFIPCLLSIGLFSSCLKDTPYLDVSHTQPIIEFGQTAANGLTQPLQYDSSGTSLETDVDTAIGLVIASPQVLSQSYTITVGIDTSQISAFNAANIANQTSEDTLTFTMLPSSMYSLPDTVITIPAGYRVGRIPVTLYLSQLPLYTPYALPLKIINGGGLLISGATYPNNSSQFMWWFFRYY
jgi:hypothetical protein